MTAKRYVPRLTVEERDQLEAMCRRGRTPVRQVLRARVLLRVDEGETDAEIAEALEVGLSTVERARKRATLEGPLEAVRDKPQTHPRRAIVLDGRAEAQLVAIACGPPPVGQARWTMRLLTDRLIELGHVERVSDETVRRVMKKKSAAALADRTVLHPSQGECAVRGGDGGCARSLPSALRPEAAAGLPRRDEQAARGACAHATAGRAWSARTGR
jgi:hypothetical protein